MKDLENSFYDSLGKLYANSKKTKTKMNAELKKVYDDHSKTLGLKYLSGNVEKSEVTYSLAREQITLRFDGYYIKMLSVKRLRSMSVYKYLTKLLISKARKDYYSSSNREDNADVDELIKYLGKSQKKTNIYGYFV